MRSEAAKAAAEIRKELKKHNIKASVRCDNYSMGSSVDVTLLNNPLPATVALVNDFCEPYGYDRGSNIDDSRNTTFRDDIPQASHVMVSMSYDDEIRAEARTLVEALDVEPNFNYDTQVYMMLNGVHSESNKLWSKHKPRIVSTMEKSK